VIEREASEPESSRSAMTEKGSDQEAEGKTAVITGGQKGLGWLLQTVRRRGCYVFITGRREKELDEAVKAIGANVSGVQGDIAQLADLDRLYETVAKVKRRIDIVFANAGVGEFAPFGPSPKNTSTDYSTSM